jgi:dipeptidyl aminopeptidase/acylaminoacyl peptidase
MLDLETLLRVPTLDTGLRFDLAPSGEKVLFSWNRSGSWEVYELDLHGSPVVRVLTDGQGGKFAPQYSPDSKMLAYAVDLDGSESFHFTLLDLRTNTVKDLTPYIDYAHQPYFAWSPEGKTLAVLSDQNGHFSLYLLPISGSPPELLMDIHHPCWDVRWSPNGQWLAVEAETTACDRGIFLIKVNDAEPFQLTWKDVPLNAQQPAWSPDSEFIAFSVESDEWHDIALYELRTKKVTWITRSIGDDTQPSWSPDGKCLCWVHAEGARTWLEVRDGDGVTKRIQAGIGIHHFPRFSPGGLVFVYEDPTHPPDLWRWNRSTGTCEQISFSLPDGFPEKVFIQPEEVHYPGRDGVEVPALLYRANDAAADTPAIVKIHGGPNWAFQFMWHPVMSHFSSRGWTVLAPNYRGSTGYGRRWQNASRFDLGGVDTEDCAAGAEFLVKRGLVDPGKIAVTGRSHGGYLTMMCLTKHPDLWACGAAIVPFLNWISSHYDSREDLQHWNIENMGDPEANRALWLERSPYFFLDKVKAPVQMIAGENDPRCPVSESIEARDRLAELGRQVELIVYPGEGHSFLNLQNVIDSELRRRDFLSRTLDGGLTG